MDGRHQRLKAVLVRERARSIRRSAELAAALADPGIKPWLDEVARRFPQITADHERLRIAQIMRGWSGQPGVRISELLACA
jgi:hypothetical protein